MRVVYVLQHTQNPDEDDEDIKLIGVFSTQELGQRAIEELSKQPGFAETKENFDLDKYEIDKTYWADGCVTIPNETDSD